LPRAAVGLVAVVEEAMMAAVGKVAETEEAGMAVEREAGRAEAGRAVEMGAEQEVETAVEDKAGVATVAAGTEALEQAAHRRQGSTKPLRIGKQEPMHRTREISRGTQPVGKESVGAPRGP
jgi:hypothetical protein